VLVQMVYIQDILGDTGIELNEKTEDGRQQLVDNAEI